jgi:thiamine pyrophosphate-dependent acetolactate synthase large subunit-like protein
MEGDAGFMMHLAEFETAARYNIPLMVCVFNDQGFAAEYHHYRKNLGDHISVVQIPTPDLGNVGVALGGSGALATSTEELRRAAEDFVANPRPMLVDVRVSREVPSIPNRRRYLGEADE